LAGRSPKGIAQEDVEWAEIVVSMGCGDACPVLPGKSYVDWDLTDPAGASIEEVRAIRDEIERRVADLPH
jgi:arsenate reductase